MKQILILAVVACAFVSLNAQSPADGAGQPMMDCSGMSADMQQFAAGLSSSNKMMFCSKFNDSMRAQAMQMGMQKDASGNMMMTSDQAVEKVAGDNNVMPMAKSAGGCPVK